MSAKSVGLQTLVPRAVSLVMKSQSTSGARSVLGDLLAQSVDGWSATALQGGAVVQDVALSPSQVASEAPDRAAVAERRLGQYLRALRREASGRNSEPAVRVLAQDAIRLAIEVEGWNRVGQLATRVESDVVGTQDDGAWKTLRSLYALLAFSDDPARHAAIAQLALRQDRSPVAAAAPLSLGPSERGALMDLLRSLDAEHLAPLRARLRAGEDITALRSMLVERQVPTSLAEVPTNAPEATSDMVGGLTFDLSTNTWVAKDRSWKYEVPLGQLFEYQVEGIIDGRSEVKARLHAACTDPATGVPAVELAALDAFIDALADASQSADPAVRNLLDLKLPLVFSTTNGGDKPVGALWELSVQAVANLVATATDPSLSGHVRRLADQANAQAAQRRQEVFGPLRELLRSYPGVPKRHKRAHGALINLGLAGQTVAEMGTEGGVLPKSKTRLEPVDLAGRYAQAEHLKLRFLFTDEYELYVIGDEMFQQVVDRYHFPPNHELLSYNRPLAGSGYLTVHEGKIVALEDDTVMLPGKLPVGLPPALEVLRARGYALDEVSIERSQRVLDWEGFTKQAQSAGPALELGDPSTWRARVEGSSHAERPGLIAQMLRTALRAQLDLGAEEAAARQKVAELAAELLQGYQLINVSARDFRKGDLPRHLTEFGDLHVDASLSECLVRKVLP